VEAGFDSAFVEYEAVEDLVVGVVAFGEVAEDEVGVRFGGMVAPASAAFEVVLVVRDELGAELVLHAGSAFESPCKGGSAVGEELFDAVLGGEVADHSLPVGVKFFLRLAFYDVGGGGQAVLEGVL